VHSIIAQYNERYNQTKKVRKNTRSTKTQNALLKRAHYATVELRPRDRNEYIRTIS